MLDIAPITVVIPIGPSEHAQDYLREAVESIGTQTVRPAALLIVDDMACQEYRMILQGIPHWVVRNYWRMGVAHSYNIGVGASTTECVLLMGADDTLDPGCIENCWHVYEKYERPDNIYFWLGVKYSDGREDQFLPCNAAMVTKSLWRATGGFPPETASGASDAALISSMLVRPELFKFVGVNKSKPLYNYRVHDETDTAKRGRWQQVILETRDLLTELWQAPEWGRY